MQNQDIIHIKWVLIFVDIEYLQLIDYLEYLVKRKSRKIL